jgi:hypothetical protein
MATRTLAQKALDEAHAMALQGHTWHRGRSKANGRAFYVIPSRSEPGVAHWTTPARAHVGAGTAPTARPCGCSRPARPSRARRWTT